MQIDSTADEGSSVFSGDAYRSNAFAEVQSRGTNQDSRGEFKKTNTVGAASITQ
jgi:hypothetical protein